MTIIRRSTVALYILLVASSHAASHPRGKCSIDPGCKNLGTRPWVLFSTLNHAGQCMLCNDYVHNVVEYIIINVHIHVSAVLVAVLAAVV